ncbi:hypothetical protein [Pseudomonas mandelii]|uniref:hypothetical protein n=1 Tax=Pseudomonas mandelii TaxID=75612 RepID=UPI00224B1EF9|nr:hypothetical protein [Pseudomonas mandelii]MCX2898766.1 hypothetical protein [Pseudomonas mandelii]
MSEKFTVIIDEFSKSSLAIGLLITPMVLSIASFIFSIYLSRRHLDAIMEALITSRFLIVWGAGWGRQGWVGGIILITKVAGIFVMPTVHIRYGEVDAIEIRDFPRHLKRLLIIYVVMVAVSIVWAAFMVLLFKL